MKLYTKALCLAIAAAFAGSAGAQRVVSGNATPTNGSTITSTTTSGSSALTTNTTSSIPVPSTTGPAASNSAGISSSPTGTTASGSTSGATSGTSGIGGSGTSSANVTGDTRTLQPSSLNSGTANALPTGTDNTGTATAAAPAPFDSGTGTVLGAPAIVPAAPLTDEFIVGPNGERIPVTRTATAPAAETQLNAAASRALDARLERSARETRARVERKGQVLDSVAPRTNVDRSNEMPDNPGPLLSPGGR